MPYAVHRRLSVETAFELHEVSLPMHGGGDVVVTRTMKLTTSFLISRASSSRSLAVPLALATCLISALCSWLTRHS
jgi:hypothetical protein